MRDLSNHEKNEAAKLNKQVEKLNNDMNNLQKDKERLESEIAQQQEKMIDLHEQVNLWAFVVQFGNLAYMSKSLCNYELSAVCRQPC